MWNPLRKRKSAPALRQLARLTTAVVVGVAILLAATLYVMNTLAGKATDRVSSAAADVSSAPIIETQFRRYERLSAQYKLTANRAYDAQRREVAAMLNARLEDLRRDSQSPYETRVLAQTRRSLDTYFETRRDAEAAGHSAEVLVSELQPLFAEVLVDLQRLRALHANELDDARRDAAALRTASLVAAGAGVVLIAGAMFSYGAALRRWAYRPLGEVSRTIDRIGTGDSKARLPHELPEELGEIAGSVNHLAQLLALQRENQVRYLAMLAHDLRNPLAGMRVTIDAFRRNGMAPEAKERACELVDKQINRLDRMVRELQDAARMEAGHLAIRRDRTDLCAIVRDVCDLHHGVSPRHVITLSLPDAPVLGDVDATRIEQALTNLVLNAVRYSPEGGDIRVSLRSRANEACLCVKDEGIGIPPEDLPKVFVPVWRRETRGEGTGMGLPIVRQIVEAHGGRVDVESKPGAGSTFCLHLPLADASKPDEPVLDVCPREI